MSSVRLIYSETYNRIKDNISNINPLWTPEINLFQETDISSSDSIPDEFLIYCLDIDNAPSRTVTYPKKLFRYFGTIHIEVITSIDQNAIYNGLTYYDKVDELFRHKEFNISDTESNGYISYWNPYMTAERGKRNFENIENTYWTTPISCPFWYDERKIITDI